MVVYSLLHRPIAALTRPLKGSMFGPMSRSALGDASLRVSEFDALCARAWFVSAVQEGLRDAKAGRVVSNDALGRLLDRRYGALPRRKRQPPK